jgi:hypothetical protein
VSLTLWKHSLRQTFRLFGTPSDHLRVFLDANGKSRDQVLAELPYSARRSKSDNPSSQPDSKRYRDPRYLYESIGLLFEDSRGFVHLTELGKAVSRWIDELNEGNANLLARHLAYALNWVQLRNPTTPGREYAPDVSVFPARFIWEAMVALDGKISSDEINRGIMRTTNHEGLLSCISRIGASRISGNLDEIGQPCVEGTAQNDRIIPWVSIASFGWTLIADKVGGFYSFQPWASSIIREALMVRVHHREFSDVTSYIKSISKAACLPPDLRT